MSGISQEQRAAWRELAIELDQYAENGGDKDASAAILALLAALEREEAEHEALRRSSLLLLDRLGRAQAALRTASETLLTISAQAVRSAYVEGEDALSDNLIAAATRTKAVCDDLRAALNGADA